MFWSAISPMTTRTSRRRRSAIVDGAATKGDKLLVHPVGLCATVWVLETAYDYDRSDVAVTLDRILRTAQFEDSGQGDCLECLG